MLGCKVIDEVHPLSYKRGHRLMRREVWVDVKGRVSRYYLARIDHERRAGDNGRVMGHDHQHGWHHRHHFGEVTPAGFVGFGHTEARFEADSPASRTRT